MPFWLSRVQECPTSLTGQYIIYLGGGGGGGKQKEIRIYVKWGWDGGGRPEGDEGESRMKIDDKKISGLEAERHYLHRLCTAIRPFWLSRVPESPSTSLKGQYNQLGEKEQN